MQNLPSSPGNRRIAKLVTIIIVASFLLSGCTPWWSGGATTSETCFTLLGDPPAPITGVFVQPDDGYAPVLDEIHAARCTIDLNVYMLTDDEVFDALFAAEERGVEVRVILEQHPFGMFGDQQEAFDRLTTAGIAVRWEPAGLQFSHAKYMVVDGRTALIMNQNLTGAAFNSNREFGVITTRLEEVAHAQALFHADWTESSTGTIDGPLLVSPDNARARLLDFIASAQTSIDVYAEIIRDDEILAALRASVGRGVRVRLIMNASLDEEDIAAVNELSDAGVDVRLMERLYIHSKTMVVDGEQALVGSINYSETSLDNNREVAMIVDEAPLLTRINAVFERDWVRAVPLENA